MKKLFYLIISIGLLSSCKKFLDEKPDVKLALPNTLVSLQGLLDKETFMNVDNGLTGEASADNYYVTDAALAALSSQAQRNMYTWGDDITLLEFPNPWGAFYNTINVSNIVLENLEMITPENKDQSAWNNIKGSALVYRSKCFLAIIGYWAKAYNENTAVSDLGIPLRLSSDYNIVSVRASVKECYYQVINDLKQAVPLLPAFPQHVMRPSKGAAYGFLARTYLYMGMYDSASVYADKCISTSGNILNYNTLVVSATNPVPLYNSEVIMHNTTSNQIMMSNSRAIVDSNLYASYQSNDLRRSVFFKDNGNKTFGFKGSYSQSSSPFTGLAVDEIWLIKSECLARSGNVSAAMDALNKLMEQRWKTGTFIPFKATDMNSAMQIILAERRKELLFRDLRWMDLKRLNREPALQQTIYRKVNGQTYQLLPNDNRYALPIPNSVIQISGIPQNPR